jgi:hypothetical protein
LRDENRHVDREIVLRTLGEINEIINGVAKGLPRGPRRPPVCVFTAVSLA